MNKHFALSFFTFFLLDSFTLSAKQRDERPNILWITTEDISPHLGCYGDEYAYTPVLDNLAKEGILFTNAYAPAPVCTPARSSLITGLYASSLGTQHLRGKVPLSKKVKCFTEYLRNAGYYCLNFNKTDYNFDVPQNAWDYTIDWIERIPHDSLVTKYLDEVPDNKPFFCVFNFFLTHQSQTRYGLDKLNEINNKLPPEARHNPHEAPVPPYYPNTREVRTNIAALHTQITLLDIHVGEILEDLEHAGLANNTIVFFYSDHGDGLPRHKRWIYGSGTRVPFIIRFPEKYQHLAPAGPGEKATSLINFVDLAPTMLSITGCEIPGSLHGKIFLGTDREESQYTYAIRDRIDEVYEFIRSVNNGKYQYIRNFSNDKPRMQWSSYSEITPIRKEIRRLDKSGLLNCQTGWLMQNTKPIEELYDIREDPYQMNNLADDPRYLDTLKKMKAVLFEWMVDTRDLSLIPEPLMRSLAGNQSPKDALDDDESFPVEKVLSYADMKGRGESCLDDLIHGLSDPSPVVRYWSAAGLSELGEKAKPAEGPLKSLLTDDYTIVGIAAADALCKTAYCRDAMNTLGDALLDEDIVTRLYAAFFLIENKAKANLVQDKIIGSLETKPKNIPDGNYTTYLKNAIKRINREKNHTSSNLFPGSKIYDVTDPSSWGGDPALAATPDDPSDDDAIGINAALQAAADFIDSIQVGIEVDWQGYGKNVYQQLIYIPGGTYHLASSIIFPPTQAYPVQRWGRKERFLWMHGEDEKETVLKLKDAEQIGVFGSNSVPRPVVQVVQYDPEAYQGNDNFQLFVTDLSVIVPAGQPHAIGLSYGTSNLGAVRNVTIRSDGEAGLVGFALVQRNTGPGMIENLTVEGFDKGVEIIDPWGEAFTFKDITLRNQNAGGIGISVADKQIGLEKLTVEQDQPDVIPVMLNDDHYFNTEHGGMPHLTLINAEISSTVESNQPAVKIERGHIYLRNIITRGYGEDMVLDHGERRTFPDGTVKEYVSVHGKTDQEEESVIYSSDNAPEKSLDLAVVPSPEIPEEAFRKLHQGDYTLFPQQNTGDEQNEIKTSWAIIDPARSVDDTEVMQSALNSGARYVGILNTEPVIISGTIVINGEGNKNVELIMGYMSEIHLDDKFSLREVPAQKNENIAFRIETGASENIFFKGINVTADRGDQSDFLLFQNNSGQNVIFEDMRCMHAPRVYKNGNNSLEQNIFFNNVEFVYFGTAQDIMMHFDRQNVWARQFDIEWLGSTEKGHAPLVVNSAGQLWVFSQKYGEHHGIFVQTENGGKTELLSVFYNSSRTADYSGTGKAANFLVKDAGSQFSMVGQERIRVRFDRQGNATNPLPHGNRFGIVIYPDAGKTTIKGTGLPTYLSWEGTDPFEDDSYKTYDKKNHYRVAGLLRVNIE